MFKPNKYSSNIVLPAAQLEIPMMPDILHYERFLSLEESNFFLDNILNDIEFKSETYVFNNETIQSKRKISYHSELPYSYSNQSYSGKAWTPALLVLKEKIEALTGDTYNAVLINYYEDGGAGMGWHSDKEKELGKNPIIASLSLGETRRFAFRHRKDVVNLKNPKKLVEYTLNSGDLFIMQGTTQEFFEHSLIADKSKTGKRLNFTFRKIVNS